MTTKKQSPSDSDTASDLRCHGTTPLPEREPPEADFYDPIAFTWSEEGYRVRQALRQYSEALDADPFGASNE